jgi:TPR repeat protein/peptidoglycan hydrolase-like protein with peptidoglycan-binding domain
MRNIGVTGLCVCVLVLAGCQQILSEVGQFSSGRLNYLDMSDTVVCSNALTPQSEPLDWDRRKNYAGQVREAKRRGLSLRRCAELTARGERLSSSSATPSLYSNMSDEYVCTIALTMPSQPLDWHRHSASSAHILEAKRRGLSIQRCGELTGRGARVVSSPVRTDYQAGNYAYQRGDYATALREWKPLAERGHVAAQSSLGFMYDHGQGVPQDYDAAVMWYRKAADQGDARAQFNLGTQYESGQGVPQDYDAAVMWYRKAADQGDASAQSHLGLLYSIGKGVPEDDAEAVKWLRKAADQGDADGQFGLGAQYQIGQGVPQDYAEAMMWYRKAAKQGNVGGQIGLGTMYGEGLGVPQDYAEAYFWGALGAKQGFEVAIKYRNMVAKHLSAAQLSRVQERVGQGMSAANSSSTVANNPPPSPAPTPLIRDVQARLARLGYDTGAADGVMGRKTRNAIEAFQRAEGLSATGEATETLAKLMETKLASRQEPPRSVAPIQTADLGTFHALVIGNDAYRALPRLRTAVKDAYAVAKLLESRYGFRATTLINATRDDVIQALQKMRNQLTEHDNLLIYYAGHGKLDRGSDRGYWLPIDATEESPVNWINNVTITDTLKAIQARHVMVVADSCYSGTLTRDTRGIKVRLKKSDYVTKTHRKKSRTVLASGGLEPVSDSGGSGHSVFAKAFMDALRDNEGVIDGLDVFAYVRKQVRLNADQVPNYANIRYAGHEVGGDFLFARSFSR